MAERSTASPHEGALGGDLLATKLSAPRIRADRLPRSRLVNQLDEGVALPLVVVCTPAGFGKTTLLADWAAGATRPVGWLSLDLDDNDPVRFWRYVVAALDRVSAGLGARMLPLLAAPGVLSSRGVVAALINELEATSADVVLVLDDYHLLESPAIHEDITFLLSRIPPRFHLLVGSRSDPPLPLARLRASGELAELRAADLRFTPEESAVYLRDVCGLELSAQAVADLEARTEGWAVGLQLAALSLRERPEPETFLHAFTGSHRYILDYLSEEVLERQPEPVRTFLLRNSILDRLTGPLCDAVTGGTGGHDTLEKLERANLFLIPLDEQRRWYRFHHLFAELLRARLQRVEPGRVPDLHRSAAAWHERHGLIDDAIRHALAAGDADWATELVEQHLNGTLLRGETVALARWIGSLPAEAVSSRPSLCLAQGLMELHTGHLDAVEHCITHAKRAFDQGQQQQQLQVPTDGGMVAEVPAAIALLRAELAAARGDADRMAESANSALEHAADHERGPRTWARWFLACAAWMRGQVGEAEPAFARVLSEARTAPATYPMMATCLPLGRVQHARGRLDDALRTYEDGLRLATEGGGPTQLYHAAEAHLGIAMVRYERDELTNALEHVTAGLEAGRQVVDLTTPVLGLVTLGWTEQALGNPVAALDAIDEACRLRGPDVVAMWNPAPAERARLLLAQGQLEDAAAWTRGRGLTEDDDVPFPGERDYLVLARVLLARDAPDRALRLLDRLDQLADVQSRVHSLIKIRGVRSLALQAAGDHRSALAVLTQALTLARPEGYVRAFADEGPPMAALLRSMVSARPRVRLGAEAEALRGQVNRILQAFEPGESPAVPLAPGLVEPLTHREAEVLPLLAEGLSNREIAQQLVVTLDTVKKHISHILSKLGATSRTQAVTKARELGLLS